MKALITRKVGMTSVINEDGSVAPVTLLSADTHVVTQIKSLETDGYNALQVGTGTAKKAGKSLAGHTKKAKLTPKIMNEFRIDDPSETLNVGDQFSVDVFVVGDRVKVTGTSKGKGWGGTIKRHGFHRGRKTHGGGSYRRPGSIGSMYPQKIFKGKKMAGQTGHDTVTTRNLTILLVDTDLKVIGVKGAVPGPRRGIVKVEAI